MDNKYQGRPLEEIAKKVEPHLPEIFKHSPLSTLEIYGSFGCYEDLGDLTVKEAVEVTYYLIDKGIIEHKSIYGYNLSNEK